MVMRRQAIKLRKGVPPAGLYYYRARYYDPNNGKFLSEDPIRFAGSLNFYGYTGNGATNFTDPSGLFSCDWHTEISKRAASAVGFPSAIGESLGYAVCHVDDNTQGTDPQSTHQHAMAGYFGNGNWESCETAYEGTKKLLQQFMQTGKIVNALHLLQDQWPSGHYGYQGWGGYDVWPAGASPFAHWWGDFHPSATVVDEAVQISIKFLKDAKNHNFQDPSVYLPNTCGCQK